MKILVIHGPNLPFLGKVGAQTGQRWTLDKIDTHLRRQARKDQIELKIQQLYSEEKIIKAIARSRREIAGLLIAPGALALNCPVLRELLSILNIPTVEVHLVEMPQSATVFQDSWLKSVAVKRILASGWEAYCQGLQELRHYLAKS